MRFLILRLQFPIRLVAEFFLVILGLLLLFLIQLYRAAFLSCSRIVFFLVRSFASVSMVGECKLRVDERSSGSYVGHDDFFFQEKSLPLR